MATIVDIFKRVEKTMEPINDDLYATFINSDKYKKWTQKEGIEACWKELSSLAEDKSTVVSSKMLFEYFKMGKKTRDCNAPPLCLLSFMVVCTYGEYGFLFKHALKSNDPRRFYVERVSSHNLEFLGFTPDDFGFPGKKWNRSNNFPCIKVKIYFEVDTTDNTFETFKKMDGTVILDMWMKEDFTPIHALFCFAEED